MTIPNPILLAAATPSSGLLLPVTGDPGGLAGYTLLSVSGPPVTLELSPSSAAPFAPVTLPVTLTAGQTLRLTRADSGRVISTIHATCPGGDGTPEAYITETDAQGYQTITNAEAITEPDGYQTLPDATEVTDSDGYVTVERSTP